MKTDKMSENSENKINQSSQFWNFVKPLVYVLFALLFVALGAIGFWFLQNKMLAVKEPSPVSEVSLSPVIVKPQASSVPLPSPTATVVPVAPSPSVLPAMSDLEAIKQAFSEKYGHPVSEVNVNISKNTGSLAQGGVGFEGEMGGGWFLAAKTADGWVIVDDGNGTISCELIEPYGFPVDMVPECVDSGGNLIVR